MLQCDHTQAGGSMADLSSDLGAEQHASSGTLLCGRGGQRGRCRDTIDADCPALVEEISECPIQTTSAKTCQSV